MEVNFNHDADEMKEALNISNIEKLENIVDNMEDVETRDELIKKISEQDLTMEEKIFLSFKLGSVDMEVLDEFK